MSSQEKPQATYEQAIAIDNARLGQSFKVIAYAGTGKTTTLQMISDAMPQRRGIFRRRAGCIPKILLRYSNIFTRQLNDAG